jgi:hypothetical protein
MAAMGPWSQRARISPQLSEVFLHGAMGGNTLAPMLVPERLTFAAPGMPSGEVINVGQ